MTGDVLLRWFPDSGVAGLKAVPFALELFFLFVEFGDGGEEVFAFEEEGDGDVIEEVIGGAVDDAREGDDAVEFGARMPLWLKREELKEEWRALDRALAARVLVRMRLPTSATVFLSLRIGLIASSLSRNWLVAASS